MQMENYTSWTEGKERKGTENREIEVQANTYAHTQKHEPLYIFKSYYVANKLQTIKYAAYSVNMPMEYATTEQTETFI